MKYLKSFKIFKEDAMASSSTAGMGSVSNSQPGSFSGDTSTSTTGSGDIPFYLLRKGKRKKGNPSEVTDLRDLEEADVEEVNDLKESKIFENSTNFNWLITYTDYDTGEDFILWLENLDGVYESIKKILFKDDVDEIEFTSQLYNEWHGGNTCIRIYKVGKEDPEFLIDLNSGESWKDFLDFYNNAPITENLVLESNCYGWVIVTDLSGFSFVWCDDIDDLYLKLKNIIFDNLDEEITYTNISYDEWNGWCNFIKIYKSGDNNPQFEIELDSNSCWNDFLNFYNNPINESNFVNQSEVDDLLDRIASSGITSLSDIEKNRLELFSTEDKEIIDTIEKMGDITNKFRKLNKRINQLSSEGKSEEAHKLMDYWMELNNELRPLEQSFRKWGIDLGDERLDNLMRKIRPDAYNPVIESKKKFPNIKKMEIDGFEVLMGKDAESNDYLTMQMRRDGDLWFHAHGFPGSHIILRCGTRIPDQNTKIKIAELAVKNSKASGLATVICCPIGLVKKEPGSNPGKVKVENNLNVEKIEVNL